MRAARASYSGAPAMQGRRAGGGRPAGARRPRPRARQPLLVTPRERRLVDGFEDLVQGEDESALRVAEIAAAQRRLDLGPLGQHRATDEQAVEEVARQVHDESRRAADDDAVLVDLDHDADAAVERLVRDVLRQRA